MAPVDPLPILSRVPVVPVLTIETAREGVAIARALAAGGLPVLEVTLRTRAALEAIRAMIAEVPDAIVGAGTVLSAPDIDASVKAGARFLVSPGTPGTLATAFAACPIPVIPGCATVTEAMALAALGFSTLKFFPAEASGGIAWLKSVAAPLPALRFCPTGGIDMKNAAAYLALPNVVCVGGSWVVPKDAAAGDGARITALAREAAGLKR